MTTPPDLPLPASTPGAPGPLAEWADRAVALVIDLLMVVGLYVVVLIVAAIIGVVSDTLGTLVALLGNLVLSLYGIYLGFLEGAKGQSPGKALRGLKVVKIADGQVLGGGMGIVRRLAHFLDSLVCFIGWFLPLFDAQKQTIADKLVQTVVLKNQGTKPFSQEIFMP